MKKTTIEYNLAYLTSLKKTLQDIKNPDDASITWLCQVLGSLVEACSKMPPLDIQRVSALWLIEHINCIYEAYVHALLDAHQPNWRYHDPSQSMKSLSVGLTQRSGRIARLAAHTVEANIVDDTLIQLHSWMGQAFTYQSKRVAAALPTLTQFDQVIKAQIGETS